jgi:hypothetical protein
MIGGIRDCFSEKLRHVFVQPSIMYSWLAPPTAVRWQDLI